MATFNVVLGLAMLLLVGWFCTRSPSWLAKFIDRYVIGSTDVSHDSASNREFITYLRKYPESWHLRYPGVLRAIRLTGWLVFVILAGSVLMIFLTWIGVAELSG